jgi:hypothetical protein
MKDISVGAGAPPILAGHTPGPWRASIDLRTGAFTIEDDNRIAVLCSRADWDHRAAESAANARLIAAAPDLLSEMKRYLPLLERLEAEPALWERLTVSLGIATLNGYRAAIAKATP